MLKIKQISFVVIFFLLSAKCAFSQNSFSDYGFMLVGAKGGMLIPNSSEDNTTLGNTGVATFDVGVGERMVGPQFWKNYWNNPYFGARLSFDRIVNSLVGNRLSAVFFTEVPFVQTNKWNMCYYVGFGLSYLTNHYDSVSNPNNIYIGSHHNAFISLGLTNNFILSERTTLFSAVKFSHSSNGTIMCPNKGINVLELELGTKINLHPYSLQKMEQPVYQDKKYIAKENSLFVTYAPIINSSRKTWEHYFSSELTFGYRRKFHPCFAYGGGFDLMYDGSLADNYEPMGLQNNWAESAFGIIEMYWGNLSLRGAVGVYIHRGVNFSLPYYEKIGAYYAFGKKNQFYTGVSIKAHAAHAQFVEWTLGCDVFKW